ncbi:MAG: NADH-quinone oxidoreductase subunit L [Candidatus Latescibacteria bacterium]|nr:NADH-quinone oxidoreductase subunit L [Candidatus Latescibacterota bacterium]NIM22004.1 NADH-quinone oxidoreductase subunit L [Candidatus Latescibacterota bacterium]NIM66022.1 NADH-quinone oxidoreductase subunit L [Candidatus Latescibacterota bacterium]NIO02430.1 NADH-quinone oxidoreductase subunit L [Candidatus Latescibacterota bacterium]NIO29341.1 NADH-quinone oxidoreductase subunit L [Candidatus Latescibacterota bacterium]
MESYLWIIPFSPLIGAAINGALAILYSHKEKGPREEIISFIGCAAPLASFVIALMIFIRMIGMDEADRILEQTLFPWIWSGALNIEVAFFVDALSMVMVLVVTCVGTIIHFYSIGYMAKDRGFARYFSYLNLFMFAMLTLVMGKNLPLLFVGWEGVGLCSYLLIGFWYSDIYKAAAGKKAFIVNRIGDFAFLLGIFVVYVATLEHGAGTLDFPALSGLVAAHPEAFRGVATAAGILLFIGACGKSAQIPLYVWLPDAMAGPTPVSALIHAATMVTAGVYMIARLSFLYALSPLAMGVVATVGALTALYAATIGICQRDIKKVLAYSTISQLGYMFMAVGVGAFSAGIFHLMTHAFFKACLFLGAGSVIHALRGEQDMFNMGGLSKYMKLTALTFLIASFAIAGVPPLAGFFSKDEILWSTFTSSLSPGWLPMVLWVVTFIAAGITAFYVFRAVFLTFYGKKRLTAEAEAHVHESPSVMTVPLILLAIGSITAGFLGVPQVLGGSNAFHHFLSPAVGAAEHVTHAVQGAGDSVQAIGAAAHAAKEAAAGGVQLSSYTGEVLSEAGGGSHGGSHGLEILLMVLSVLIGIAGILVAQAMYIRNPTLPESISRRARGLYNLVYGKYFVDEAYRETLVKPGYFLSEKVFFKVIDVWIIDGIVNGFGVMARGFGTVLRLLQTGVVRTYALFILLGILYLIYRMVG